MTDEGLLDQSRRGDDEAFRTLYERYRGPLFRFGYRLTGSSEVAEDLVHDCFLSLFRGGFDARRGLLKTYLYMAVRNLSRKRFRDSGREDPADETGEIVSERVGPLDVLISRETAQEVRSAVEALPMLQREVLVLFEYEELALEQVAEIVGAEVGAVKSRLHRAREGLRKSLAAKHDAPKERAR